MIKNRRIELKLSQKTLSKRIGISKSYMSRIENDKKCREKIGFDLTVKIARELKICPYFLFGYISNAPKPHECNSKCMYIIKEEKCNEDK